METPLKKSFNHGGHDKGKYTNWKAESKKVRKYLSKHNATATMCAVDLKIYRPNLCRHKAQLQKLGLLKVTHNGICKVTGFKADYLTCNINKLKGGKNV